MNDENTNEDILIIENNDDHFHNTTSKNQSDVTNIMHANSNNNNENVVVSTNATTTSIKDDDDDVDAVLGIPVCSRRISRSDATELLAATVVVPLVDAIRRLRVGRHPRPVTSSSADWALVAIVTSASPLVRRADSRVRIVELVDARGSRLVLLLAGRAARVSPPPCRAVVAVLNATPIHAVQRNAPAAVRITDPDAILVLATARVALCADCGALVPGAVVPNEDNNGIDRGSDIRCAQHTLARLRGARLRRQELVSGTSPSVIGDPQPRMNRIGSEHRAKHPHTASYVAAKGVVVDVAVPRIRGAPDATSGVSRLSRAAATSVAGGDANTARAARALAAHDAPAPASAGARYLRAALPSLQLTTPIAAPRVLPADAVARMGFDPFRRTR